MDGIKNFAKATVSTGYNAAATSIVLTTGHGAKLPVTPFNAVWWNSTDYADPADDPNVEVVRVTAIATDTLTVTRAQEGTSASTKNTAAKTYKMIAPLTAKYWLSALRRPGTRHWRQAQPIHGGDLNSIGMGIFITGSSSTISPSATEPTMVNYATAATTNSTAGVSNNGNAIVRTGRNIYFSALVKLQETAATRVWIGLFFSSIATVLGADTLGDFAGFRYSTVPGDTNFKCCTGLVSQTTTDSGVAADTNIHLFEIVFDDVSANVKFYIDGVLVATNTTNLPSGDNLQVVIGEATQANVAKNIRVGFVHVEDDL